MIVVRTAYPRDLRGRTIKDPRVAARLESHGRLRSPRPQPCRICPGPAGREPECAFCDSRGYARAMCGDCEEALPGCRCMRASGFVRRVGE